MKTFDFFFNDYITDKMAPDGFIEKVLTRLDSTLYKPLEVVIYNDQKVNELIIVGKG